MPNADAARMRITLWCFGEPTGDCQADATALCGLCDGHYCDRCIGKHYDAHEAARTERHDSPGSPAPLCPACGNLWNGDFCMTCLAPTEPPQGELPSGIETEVAQVETLLSLLVGQDKSGVPPRVLISLRAAIQAELDMLKARLSRYEEEDD